MLEQLNSCLLNQVANGILFLVLIAVYISTLLDRRFGSLPRDGSFSSFILFSAAYIALHVAWLSTIDAGLSDLAVTSIRFLRVLSAFAAYCFIGLWLLSVIQEKRTINQRRVKAIKVSTLALFLMSTLLAAVTGNALAANIPILAYYLMLECLVIRYREALGKTSTIIMTMLIVPSLGLQAQEWWNYTPANIYLVLVILVIYSRMWIEQKERHLEEQRLAAEQRADLENARTKLVLSQIKPHFLYNTLGTIAYLCDEDPREAQSLTYGLSDYLRGNLSALDGGRMVPFPKELQHVKTYLNIEKVRFEDALQVKYDIRAWDFMLPVLTVEPLVENAVKHGICQRPGGGTVTLSSYQESTSFVVSITDDGIGFDAESFDEASSEHMGIRSVRTRIELLANGTLSIHSTPGKGTTAILRIPLDQPNEQPQNRKG